MYVLLFVFSVPFAYMGDYKDLSSCQNAVREIYATRMNPPNQRLKELESAIDLQVKNSKEFVCVKKG